MVRRTGPKQSTHCSKCAIPFTSDELRYKGRKSMCVPCGRRYFADYANEWRRKNPERHAAAVARRKKPNPYGAPNRKVRRDICGKCGAALNAETANPRPEKAGWFCKKCVAKRNAEWHERNPIRARHLGARGKMFIRVDVMRAYGGKCACCGESRWEYLCIDHIDGGGNQHRKSVRAEFGRDVYSHLRKTGFPPGYRVLCHNCNMSHGFWGYCPHEVGRSRTFAEYCIEVLGHPREIVESLPPIDLADLQKTP